MTNVDKPVYLVGQIAVKDMDDFTNRYVVAVGAQLQSIGAELVIADAPEIVEGDPTINRTVVIRFPNRNVAKTWYESDEYAPYKKLRIEELTSGGTVSFVEEFDPSLLA